MHLPTLATNASKYSNTRCIGEVHLCINNQE